MHLNSCSTDDHNHHQSYTAVFFMDDSNVVRHIPSVTVLPQQPEWRIPPDNVHYVEYLYSCNNMV